jgi:hypothetical protein
MIDCSKVRKMVINQILPNGEVLQSTIYFDIDSGNQLTENQVSKCKNIEPLTFICADICTDENIDPNCWSTPLEGCWELPSGEFWTLP